MPALGAGGSPDGGARFPADEGGGFPGGGASGAPAVPSDAPAPWTSPFCCGLDDGLFVVDGVVSERTKQLKIYTLQGFSFKPVTHL